MAGNPAEVYQEFVADDSVEKIGARISASEFLVKHVAEGGWAESQGIQTGDVIMEINGVATPIGEDKFREALTSRPFRFRVAKKEQTEAIIKLQSIVRGRNSRKEVEAMKLGTMAFDDNDIVDEDNQDGIGDDYDEAGLPEEDLDEPLSDESGLPEGDYDAEAGLPDDPEGANELGLPEDADEGSLPEDPDKVGLPDDPDDAGVGLPDDADEVGEPDDPEMWSGLPEDPDESATATSAAAPSVPPQQVVSPYLDAVDVGAASSKEATNRREAKKAAPTKDNAATKIQSLQRGRQARKKAVEKKEKRRFQAASKIQSLQRGNAARQRSKVKREQNAERRKRYMTTDANSSDGTLQAAANDATGANDIPEDRDGRIALLFNHFDKDRDGLLTPAEMYDFALLMEFEGDLEEWTNYFEDTFSELIENNCLDLEGFCAILNDDDEDNDFTCSDEELNDLFEKTGCLRPQETAKAKAQTKLKDDGKPDAKTETKSTVRPAAAQDQDLDKAKELTKAAELADKAVEAKEAKDASNAAEATKAAEADKAMEAKKAKDASNAAEATTAKEASNAAEASKDNKTTEAKQVSKAPDIAADTVEWPEDAQKTSKAEETKKASELQISQEIRNDEIPSSQTDSPQTTKVKEAKKVQVIAEEPEMKSPSTSRTANKSGKIVRADRDDPETAPSLELITDIFKQLDSDGDNYLDEREMLRFIRCLDYPGSPQEWTREFAALCEFHGWDATKGLDFQGLVTLVDDADDNYFVESEQLVQVLKDLELHAPLAALGARAVTSPGARVPPGHDDAPYKEFSNVMDIPITLKFEELDFEKLIANEVLSTDFQDSLIGELASITELEESAFKISLSQQGQGVQASIILSAKHLDEARAVLRALESAGGDLQAMLGDAVRSIRRIRQAASGPIETITVVIGDAAPPRRGRQSMIEQGFAAASATSMKGLLEATRSRDVSPDSGKEGSFVFSPYESDMEFGSPSAGKGPSPSRKAFFDGQDVFASRAKWPGGRRVEYRRHLNHFKSVLLKRERSLATGWRNFIDTHWRGRISLYDFSQACAAIGYGNKKQVWKELDVDNAGSVTLKELDWEAADLLGSFYSSLNQRYGSCKAAAKKWNLSGPRRIHQDEFLQLLVPKGIISAPDAEQLFGMLCSCPYGNGHNLENTAPAITLREIQWLNKMGPTLPRPAFDRVSPGMLGKTTLSTSTPGVTPGGFGSPGSTQQAGFGSPGAMSGFASPASMQFSATPRTAWDGTALLSDDSTRMETGEDDDSGSDSASENNIFMKLYAEAMEHHGRRTKLMVDKQYDFKRENPHLIGPAKTKLFERLYADHDDRVRKKEDRVRHFMDQLQKEFNQEDVGEKKISDKKARQRLAEPKKTIAQKPTHAVDGNSLRQEHVWEKLNIHGLMEAATNRIEVLKEKGKEVSFLPFGKTREELLSFLKKNADAVPKPLECPENVQKLHEDGKKKQEAIEKMALDAEAAEKEQEKKAWICDVHKTNPHRLCRLCKRYKAIQEGADPAAWHLGRKVADGQTWQRLYDEGLKHHGDIDRAHAQAFNHLLNQADRMGLMHGKSVKVATRALQTVFEDDERWRSVRGLHREQLIAEALQRFTLLRQEAEARGRPYGQKNANNPETFFRLYLDGATNTGNRDDRVRMKMMEEEQMLKKTSVHAKTEPSPGVFHRLYEGLPRQSKPRLVEKRGRQVIPADIAQQLANKIAVKDPLAQQMLVFNFPDAAWPPSQYFESEFRFNMEKLGAPSMHQFNVRLKEGAPGSGAGIIVEMRGQDKQLQNFYDLALSDLTVTHCPVTEVWSQEAQEDPIGDFVDWICEKFNSLEDAFYIMDNNGAGTISRPEFMAVCTSQGFTGNKIFVWHALDNGMGSLDIQDWMCLQPYIAHKASLSQRPHTLQAIRRNSGDGQTTPAKLLVDFAIFLASQFPDIDTAYSYFNTSGYGQLGFSEFQAGARSIGWTAECRQIFQELDVTKKRQIGRKEFQMVHDALMEEQAEHNQKNRGNPKDPGYQSYEWQKTSLHANPKAMTKGKGMAKGKSRSQAGWTGASPMASPMNPAFSSSLLQGGAASSLDIWDDAQYGKNNGEKGNAGKGAPKGTTSKAALHAKGALHAVAGLKGTGQKGLARQGTATSERGFPTQETQKGAKGSPQQAQGFGKGGFERTNAKDLNELREHLDADWGGGVGILGGKGGNQATVHGKGGKPSQSQVPNAKAGGKGKPSPRDDSADLQPWNRRAAEDENNGRSSPGRVPSAPQPPGTRSPDRSAFQQGHPADAGKGKGKTGELPSSQVFTMPSSDWDEYGAANSLTSQRYEAANSLSSQQSRPGPGPGQQRPPAAAKSPGGQQRPASSSNQSPQRRQPADQSSSSGGSPPSPQYYENDAPPEIYLTSPQRQPSSAAQTPGSQQGSAGTLRPGGSRQAPYSASNAPPQGSQSPQRPPSSPGNAAEPSRAERISAIAVQSRSPGAPSQEQQQFREQQAALPKVSQRSSFAVGPKSPGEGPDMTVPGQDVPRSPRQDREDRAYTAGFPQAEEAPQKKRQSLMDAARAEAAGLMGATRLGNNRQDDDRRIQASSGKLYEIQEEDEGSVADGPAGSVRSSGRGSDGPGAGGSVRSARAGNLDGRSSPASNMSGAPSDVKDKLLEQQWGKKASVARASLVVALQGRDT